jgi:RND family efflux transporter MFP subunit
MNKDHKKDIKKKIEQLIPELLELEEEIPDLLKAKNDNHSSKKSFKRNLIVFLSIIGAIFLIMLIPTKSSINGKARVVPHKIVIIEAKEAGILKDLYFDEGDNVKKGDLICTIYNSEYATELKKAKNEIDIISKSQSQLKKRMVWLKNLIERNNALYEDEVIAKAEMETTLLDYEFAEIEYKKNIKKIDNLEATIEYLEEAINDSNVKAPFEGVIMDQLGNILGTYIEKGDMLCEIADLSNVVLEFPVYERYIRKIEPGQSASVTFSAYPGYRTEAKVISMQPAAWEKVEKVWVKENVINVRIKVDKTPFEIKSGMTANVKIFTGNNNVGSIIFDKFFADKIIFKSSQPTL